METRVAIIAIVVENPTNIDQLNQLLHEYRDGIIGRMGVPYPKRNLSLISVAMDAPQDRISALSGKIGRIEGITARTVYSKVTEGGGA